MSARNVLRDFFYLRWASFLDQPSVFVTRLTVLQNAKINLKINPKIDPKIAPNLGQISQYQKILQRF